MSKRWATPTWYFLHMLIEKIDARHYERINKEYIGIIIEIFTDLPCPYCKTHALAYVKKHNIYNMKTKEDMKQYLFTFHNQVNTRVGNPIKDRAIFNFYKRMNTVAVSNYFMKRFFASNPLSKSFNGWQSDLKKNLLTFLNKNKSYLAG
tara:strand:+ start:5694 stop:6140 length:447 start_codon:yes stop_codon:yes gene_type:complete